MSEMKIGELARRTGLTVRTLHHYDEIGLLHPARRTASGYRVYGEAQAARLLEIMLLRRLGLSLEEIGNMLDGPDAGLGPALSAQIERLRHQIDEEQRLLRRLEMVAERLTRNGRLSASDLTTTMEMLTMHEKYFSPEQLETLSARAEHLGADQIAAAETEWPQLIAAARAALERGDDPSSPEVQDLARRWKELTQAFTGGDPAMAQSVKNLYQGEPKMMAQNGLDPSLFEYMGRAMAGLS